MADQPPANLPLGVYLRDLRRARRLTLREAEERSGVSNSYLSQVENGHIRQPSPYVLQKLAEAYSVPYEHLMLRAGYIRPEVLPARPESSPPTVQETSAPYDATPAPPTEESRSPSRAG